MTYCERPNGAKQSGTVCRCEAQPKQSRILVTSHRINRILSLDLLLTHCLPGHGGIRDYSCVILYIHVSS
jgi:hypothetical protein